MNTWPSMAEAIAELRSAPKVTIMKSFRVPPGVVYVTTQPESVKSILATVPHNGFNIIRYTIP